MSHGSNVFDGAIGHYQAMLDGKFRPLDGGAVDDLPQMHLVVRMSSLDREPEGGLCGRLAFKYSIRLVGPVDFPVQRVPAETPRVAQSLPPRQITLAPAQRLLGHLAFGSFTGFAQPPLH